MIFNAIGEGIGRAAGWTKEHVLDPVGDRAHELANMSPVDHVNALGRNLGNIGEKVVDGAKAFGDGARQFGENVVDGVKGAGESVVEGVKGASESVVEGARDFGDNVREGVQDFGESVKDGYEEGAGVEEGKLAKGADSLSKDKGEFSLSKDKGEFSLDKGVESAGKTLGGVAVEKGRAPFQDILDRTKEIAGEAKLEKADVSMDGPQMA